LGDEFIGVEKGGGGGNLLEGVWKENGKEEILLKTWGRK